MIRFPVLAVAAIALSVSATATITLPGTAVAQERSATSRFNLDRHPKDRVREARPVGTGCNATASRSARIAARVLNEGRSSRDRVRVGTAACGDAPHGARIFERIRREERSSR